MRATRRYWAVAAVGGFLAVLAPVLGRSLPLVGAIGIGAWLIAHQYRFYRDLGAILEGIDIEQTLSRERVAVEESAAFTLSVTLDAPAPLDLEVAARPPLSATITGDTAVEIPEGGREASLAGTVAWPVAGAFQFRPPRIVATDPLGLLEETVERGPDPAITVQPRAPRNVHVGEGGEQVAAAYGEHSAGRLGSGLDPAEIREYVPGDSADRIDWKATARLAEPYVREYEAETDRRTLLLVDHRAATGVGSEGETALDHLRQVALAFADSARQLSDPLGCFTVGDAGLTHRIDPDATEGTYSRIRTALYDLHPTGVVDERTATRRGARYGPADAREVATRLDGGDAFATRLRPFFADADPYVQRIEGDPLFEAARATTRIEGTVWTVLFTTDADPERVRETVKIARRGNDHVLVFLAPRVLFEAGGLADLEAAYDAYVEFEEFRRELARLGRVSAFEVAPGDRIDAVLSSGRGRRESRAVEGV